MKLIEQMRRHPVKIALVALALVALAWWIYRHQDELSKEALIGLGKSLPALWFLALFLVLPLAGFPISVFLILAGIRFGFWGGLAASGVAVFFHNFAAYRLTHGLFRTRLRAFLDRAGYAIPAIDEKNRIRVTMLFAAVHGPPYFAKLYALALTDIPFRIYFFAGASVYWAFCAIPVAIGSAVTRQDLSWVYYIVGAVVVITLGGYWLKHRQGRDRSPGGPANGG
jgi:uncharacterized membrane protein YdjX (TVP38/TMEM64 family)